MSWTDERVEILKTLWAEGLSASQIAAQLGGISRNAVIGKVHRLKLSSRGRAVPPPSRQKKPTREAPAAERPAARESSPARNAAPQPKTATPVIGATALKPRAETEAEVLAEMPPESSAVVVPISRRLALTELTERTCKWPIGDPLSEDFHFCGNDAGDSGPYCSYHSRMAFQPVAERRRK